MTARAGRPKSQEKFGAILHAAAGLFMRHGLSGTSMDAVATDAGVSKQTVYSHFESKEGLFRACIAGKLASYNLAPAALPESGDIQADLSIVVQRYMELLFDEGVVQMFRCIIGEAAAHPDVARMFWEEGPRRTQELIATYLAKRAANGELAFDDADRAALELLNLAEGQEHWGLLLGTVPPPSSAAVSKRAAAVVKSFLTVHQPGA